MKFSIKSLLGATAILVFSAGCQDVLEEQPRSFYEPGFFQTERGVQGGLTALYANLRSLYGQAYYYNSLITGTDEATYAQSADGNFLVADLSGQGELNSTWYPGGILWGTAFGDINTASGIIENATDVGISDALIGEARFFRAFDYFNLVQTYGGVPLDLGSGPLVFNTNPVRVSTRNTVPEVYTLAIFPDLRRAVEDLPDQPRVTGAVTKPLARLMLAKAYLTYGWWLENPNNIPTYPQTDRTDPDGHDAAWYFQEAYDMALSGIDNPGPFALQPTYYDVHYAPNDRNSEIMLYADHTEESEFYNGGSLTYGSGGAPDNFAVWMMTWNYTVIRSGTDPDFTNTIASVQREAAQPLGRPWTRMAPTVDVLTETFENKDQDSRYDGTFTSVYRGNWDRAGAPEEVLYNANGLPVSPGDAILTFLDEPTPGISYPEGQGRSNIGAGTLPGRSDFVIGPLGVSRVVYPGLWKLGTFRTDNNGGLGQPNAGSTRPFNIVKFSELYFIAAEAAIMGANTESGRSARELLNVIRARAGMWRYDNGEDMVYDADFSEELTEATPDEVDIYFLLAERSREYYAEGVRWYDLVRTQTWNELAGEYMIAGSAYGDHTPVTVQRTIEPYHYLRPIPQGQLDGMELEEDLKDLYQNPGYE
ncbi:RagB/SusD family nutrient uptake outer membrane protein [Lewinella sp. IMCC34183]|uniref:RagB/SusD family nutrient uptake outer membrane protein n=1 Tax=Lewinella sp. IMCC34183 TaxID=2248762 RepID=UPI0018E56C54|nr:RagB/SusD family nutrient uptake outer membrane protein [Lewinella sp. IMCC34183]